MPIGVTNTTKLDIDKNLICRRFWDVNLFILTSSSLFLCYLCPLFVGNFDTAHDWCCKKLKIFWLSWKKQSEWVDLILGDLPDGVFNTQEHTYQYRGATESFIHDFTPGIYIVWYMTSSCWPLLQVEDRWHALQMPCSSASDPLVRQESQGLTCCIQGMFNA